MGFKVAIQEEWKHENMKDKRKGSDCEVELKKIFEILGKKGQTNTKTTDEPDCDIPATRLTKSIFQFKYISFMLLIWKSSYCRRADVANRRNASESEQLKEMFIYTKLSLRSRLSYGRTDSWH